MGSFAVGDILLARFPFSNLSRAKLRPVVVIGLSEFDNFIVAQITSQTPNMDQSVAISNKDFDGDNVLNKVSYIRTSKVFTTDPTLIVKKLGKLTPKLKQKLHKQLLNIFATLNAEK